MADTDPFSLCPSCLEQIIFVLRWKGIIYVQCPAQCLEYSRSLITAIALHLPTPESEVFITCMVVFSLTTHPQRQLARDSLWPEFFSMNRESWHYEHQTLSKPKSVWLDSKDQWYKTLGFKTVLWTWMTPSLKCFLWNFDGHFGVIQCYLCLLHTY